LRRGRERIAGYASDPPYDIDVEGLTAWADALLDQLADPSCMNDVAGAPVTPRLLRPGLR
jgi:hypothetical protein